MISDSKLDSWKIGFSDINYYGNDNMGKWYDIPFVEGFNKNNCYIIAQDFGTETDTTAHIKIHDNNDKFCLTTLSFLSTNVGFLFIRKS